MARTIKPVPVQPFQVIPGPIQREGTFLYQLNTAPDWTCNLWSGRLDPNNGHDREHASKAAKLFGAAEDLLKIVERYVACDKQNSSIDNGLFRDAIAAIAKATE